MQTKHVVRPLAVDLYDAHGGAMFALATVLLSDREAAAAVVVEVIKSAACGASGGVQVARSDLAVEVLSSCRRLRGGSTRPSDAPAVDPVLGWLAGLSDLERTALALVLFGRSDSRWVADVLSVPSSTITTTLHDSLAALAATSRR